MENKKDTLDMARELGYSIIESDEYKVLIKAEDDFHNDSELVELLKQIETMKDTYASVDPKDVLNRDKHFKELSELEDCLNKNITMNKLKIAKIKYDKLFKNINNLISYITDEESRINIVKNSKKKGCSSCSGCSKK